MAFVVTQGISRVLKSRGRSMLRGRRPLTPQERTNRYVRRMPIAVLAPTTGSSGTLD